MSVVPSLAVARELTEGALVAVPLAAARKDRRIGLVTPATGAPSRAAAAFLERAASLTPDPMRGAERALAAAQATFQAGALDASLTQLATAESGALEYEDGGEQGASAEDPVDSGSADD